MEMNRASVVFRYTEALSAPSSGLVMRAASDDCYKCTPLPLRPVGCAPTDVSCIYLMPNANYTFDVDAKFPMTLSLRDGNRTVWQSHYHFTEFSNYSMLGQQVSSGEVHASIALEHAGTPSLLLPILLGLLGLWVASGFVLFFWKKHLAALRDDDADDDTRPLLDQPPPPTSSRVVCLDVFRGITIFTMIFVNYGGGDYWFFNHSTWNGLTVADLCFPWFAWIMGATMAIGLPKKLRDPRGFARTATLRSLKLFGLGLFLNNGFDLAHWRIPGVLQSFGVAYWIVAMALLFAATTTADTRRQRLLQWAILLGVVALHAVVVYGLPVAGCPRGYLGPGGIGDFGQFGNCTGGAHKAVDLALFGNAHIFQNPTTKDVYLTGAFDPEGALNWLMVAVTAFIGFQVATVFLGDASLAASQRSIRLALLALALGIAALVACQGRLNDGWIPVNKNLWSLSFVLATSSLASWLLLALFLMVDTHDMWRGAPFLQAGMNPIVLYLGHELLQDHFPFGFKHGSTSHALSLLSALLGALCWLAIALLLHRKKLFISV
ncbi:heparan-alpha-glucosaminide N-acetyltransferase [Achlya hypogyna]|uniref:Heparan-alpha-glucosaminide N-acetyltransferase n=1 Tax=Achlya hypogyna TaxID=1202772 RepID=A0A1V9YPE1_ACHHY|nr:heparan-alpha-glucosaminide N-acetyltransferase [Achlya hypogyna]